MTVVLLTGGARSGKSRIAVDLARRRGGAVTFVATAEASDEDMAERIARHRAERPAAWRLVEEPRDLVASVGAAGPGETVVLDCLTLWVSTLLADGRSEDEVLAAAEALAGALAARPGATIVVTNEVGSGVHPASALGRRYRDLLGRVNAAVAARADEAYLTVCGRLLPLLDADSVHV